MQRLARKNADAFEWLQATAGWRQISLKKEAPRAEDFSSSRGASFSRLIWRQPNIEMERSGIEMGMACSLGQEEAWAPAVPSSESETGSMACSLVQKEFWAPAVPSSESETGSMACCLVRRGQAPAVPSKG